MPLFQSSVLKKFAKAQNSDAIAKAFKKFTKHFHNPAIQENIRAAKEEQYQEGFLRELFVDVFGYTLNPQPNFNLTTELKNEKDSKKVDGAILKDGYALGVIELKGTDTKDLEKVRQQAFDYKANQSKCVYVITSNFEKLRFYINNAVEFEEFDLFSIDEKGFELMYICLAAENVLNNIPLRIKEASLAEEESITKKFYADYSLFKRELFRDLVKKNLRNEALRGHLIAEDVVKADKNIKMTLFKKSQKLIDRFLFIFFAEDRGLVPPNTTKQILADYKKLQAMDAHAPLYSRFKLYFNYLDTGRKGTDQTAEIFAYNGGLFKPDNTLDSLLIDDELLYKHTNILSNYDFESQVDVNILGHIFENSLNEIESVNAEIEGTDFDKQKTKRKKDGVFYTPKYITKYIVDNTVGKLCEEKKDELGITGEDFSPKRQKETKRQLLEKLETYREWLLQLTICDPACGSGAFLNQALDFLINEHEFVDELQAAVLGGAIVFQEIENTILENNIYGVDLNEESVEIAKLSLWLRTAQPRRKLNSLNDNIKCGNSLIESKAVAGDKAFKWEDEFPDVFKKGGFDVVIGNPPYVRKQGLVEHYPEMTNYYEKKFMSATGNYDIYALFMERCFGLINNKGLVSFILPHKFLVSDFGVGIRKFFVENNAVENLIHFGSEIVFAEASTYTCIVDLSKKKKELVTFKKIKPESLFEYGSFDSMAYSLLSEENWDLQGVSVFETIDKLKLQPYTVGDVFDNIFQGIATSLDAVYTFTGVDMGNYIKGYNDKFDYSFEIEKEIVKPFVKGNQLSKYKTPIIQNYVIFPYKDNSKTPAPIEEIYIKENLPKTYAYLKYFEKEIKGRERGRMNIDENWYLYIYPKSLDKFRNPKIMTQEISLGCNMTYDANGEFYHPTTIYSFVKNPKFDVDEKYYLGIMNSKVMWFFLKNTGTELSGGYFRFKTNYLKPFPLPAISSNSAVMIEKVNFQLETNKQLQKKSDSFTIYLQSQFSIEKLSQKLQKYYQLTFSDFIKELNKAIKTAKGTPLTKLQEMEWMEVFEVKKKEALELKAEIDRTDKEIDEMVYQLYGLTEEEIAIVENSSN